MAVGETARLIVDLSLKGNFARQLSSSSRALGKFDARLDQTESRAFRAGQQIGTGIKRGAILAATGIGILASQVVVGLDSLVKLEAQTDITNAAIKSTGGVAGITATEVRTMAEEFESVNALFGDEVIQGAENVLLSFTNIRKKAFKPTLQAAIDLSTTMGGPDGLARAAKTLGLALNDPTQGLGRLSKAGVIFTKEQQKRIKGLQKAGKLYEAQAIILAEVERRFGGRGAAFGGDTAQKVAKFHDAIEDLQRTLAAGMLPVVSNIADALSDLFRDPAIQQGVADFGKDLAAFFTPGRIKEGIASIKEVAAVIGPAFRAAGSAIKFALDAFGKLPPDLRNLLIGAFAVNKLTGGLVTNVIGGIAGALKNLIVPHMSVAAGQVTVVGPGGVGGGIAGAAKGGLSTLSKVFLVGEAIGLAAVVAAIQQDISAQISARAEEVHAIQNAFLKTNPSTEAIKNALAGVNQGINDITSNPLNVLVQGSALTELQQMKGQLSAALAQRESQNPDRREHADTARLEAIATTFVRAANREGERGRGKAPGASTETQNNIAELAAKLSPVPNATTTIIPGAINSLRDRSLASLDAMRNTVSMKGDAQRTATASGSQLVSSATRTSSLTNAAITANATRSGSSAIVAAIWAARPQINITQVTRSQTIVQRYGPGGTSSTGLPGQSGV